MTMNSDWRSKKLYRDEKGRTGRVVFQDRLKRYLFEDTGGNIYMTGQSFGRRVREIEERAALVGRPSIFPGEEVSARSITLPERLWKALGENPSREIARCLGG